MLSVHGLQMHCARQSLMLQACMPPFNRACDRMCLSGPFAAAAAQATSRIGARTRPDDLSPGTFPVFLLLLMETDGAIQTNPAPSPSADNHVCLPEQTLPCLLHVSFRILRSKLPHVTETAATQIPVCNPCVCCHSCCSACTRPGQRWDGGAQTSFGCAGGKFSSQRSAFSP